MKDGLQTLLDKEAIRDVHLRYCRGVDRGDWDMLRSCYHPDATDDHGDAVRSPEEFISFVKESMPVFESLTHMAGNQFVQVDGDHAKAEHYTVAYHRCSSDGGKPAVDITAVVRYLDELERRDGEWKISKRVVIVDSQRSDPVLDDGSGQFDFSREESSGT